MPGRDSEMEALAAVLEAESATLKAMTDEAEHVTDPVRLEGDRQKRQAYIERVQKLNEHLLKRMPD